MAVTRWVGEVVKAGGGGMIDATGAQQLLESVCKSVPCFTPLDVREASLNISGIGTCIVPFGKMGRAPYQPATSLRKRHAFEG